MTTFGPITTFIQYTALVIVCSFWSPLSAAQLHLGPASDEDTILVEHQPSKAKLYRQLLKSVTKSLFQLDVEALFSGGENSKNAVIRNLEDYADQMHYQVNVDTDSVQVKFSLNF